MKALLDTHVFIWAISEPPRLSSRVLELIEDRDNEILVSIASAWEMAIKATTGKLRVSGSAAEFVQRKLVEHRMTLLPIQLSHLTMLEKLPLHHRDPFDRLLIAQCMAEEATLITVDPLLKRYRVKIIS